MWGVPCVHKRITEVLCSEAPLAPHMGRFSPVLEAAQHSSGFADDTQLDPALLTAFP